jgi:hypothetical protein
VRGAGGRACRGSSRAIDTCGLGRRSALVSSSERDTLSAGRSSTSNDTPRLLTYFLVRGRIEVTNVEGDIVGLQFREQWLPFPRELLPTLIQYVDDLRDTFLTQAAAIEFHLRSLS